MGTPFTVDTSPLGTGTLTDISFVDNVGSFQGAILAGSTTNDNTPMVSGTANGDAVSVKVYEGSNLLGTATVCNGT